jgi:hypothetical protein
LQCFSRPDLSLNSFLQTELAKPYAKRQIELITGWVGKDKKRFSELVGYFLNEETATSKLAAGVLSQVAMQHPELVKPHLEVLIHNLYKPVSIAIKRNTVRFLQQLNLPEELQGPAADICFSYVQNPQEAIAVRAFAITVLSNLCKSQPDMMRELRLVLEEQLPFASAGFKVRAAIALAQMEKHSSSGGLNRRS